MNKEPGAFKPCLWLLPKGLNVNPVKSINDSRTLIWNLVPCFCVRLYPTLVMGYICKPFKIVGDKRARICDRYG